MSSQLLYGGGMVWIRAINNLRVKTFPLCTSWGIGMQVSSSSSTNQPRPIPAFSIQHIDANIVLFCTVQKWKANSTSQSRESRAWLATGNGNKLAIARWESSHASTDGDCGWVGDHKADASIDVPAPPRVWWWGVNRTRSLADRRPTGPRENQLAVPDSNAPLLLQMQRSRTRTWLHHVTDHN